jgi:hypothetical protein
MDEDSIGCLPSVAKVVPTVPVLKICHAVAINHKISISQDFRLQQGQKK